MVCNHNTPCLVLRRSAALRHIYLKVNSSLSIRPPDPDLSNGTFMMTVNPPYLLLCLQLTNSLTASIPSHFGTHRASGCKTCCKARGSFMFLIHLWTSLLIVLSLGEAVRETAARHHSAVGRRSCQCLVRNETRAIRCAKHRRGEPLHISSLKHEVYKNSCI